MKKIFILAAFAVVAVSAAVFFSGQASAYQNNSGYTNGWHGDGPDAIVFENGGSLTMKSGSTFTMNAGAAFVPSSLTTAQLAVSTPSAVGQIVFNSTINAVCQGNSTTAAGAWRLVSSTATACQ